MCIRDSINANLRSYLGDPENAEKPLVRFYYTDKDDVFDNVSYPKGGCILHMLRNYVGDSAFFKSLNLYLTRHKYSSAEAQDLRLAFEEVTGKDLNWFFNECLLYTSDAADEEDSVDLGGRRIIK